MYSGPADVSIFGSQLVINAPYVLNSYTGASSTLTIGDGTKLGGLSTTSNPSSFLSSSGSPWSLIVSEDSSISGFKLDKPAIFFQGGGAPLIQNCIISSSSGIVVLENTAARISLNRTAPFWTTLNPSVTLSNLVVDLAQNAKISLETLPDTTSNLNIGPSVVFGSNSLNDKNCSVTLHGFSWQGTKSSISTFCNLTLAGNITGSRQPIFGNGSFASLEILPTNFERTHYFASIDFAAFKALTLTLDSEAANRPVLGFHNSSSLQVANTPKYMHLEWDETEGSPSNISKYFLYETASLENLQLASVYSTLEDEDDIHQFEISIDLKTSVVREVFATLEKIEMPPAACLTAPPMPASNFRCFEGQWISITSITSSDIIVPPAAAVVISGDLIVSTAQLGGLGSTITVTGCISSDLSSVVIELSAQDIEKLQKAKDKSITSYFISSTTGCNSGANLGNVAFKVKHADIGCKKVVVKTKATANTLGAVFRLDNSKCNLWWIILASVLGGLVALALIIFVLLVAFVPAVRTAVRPYSKRRGHAAPQT